MASAITMTREATRDNSTRLHSVPRMMEFPSTSASVIWIAASSGFKGLSAPITRPEKGSVTSGILLRARYSSGAKAILQVRADVDCGRNERPIQRAPKQPQGHGQIGIVLKSDAAALHHPAETVGESEDLKRCKAAFGFCNRACRGEEVQLLRVAMENGVQVLAALPKEFASEHDGIRADRERGSARILHSVAGKPPDGLRQRNQLRMRHLFPESSDPFYLPAELFTHAHSVSSFNLFTSAQ
jgi:hypothetical protein